MLNRRIASSSDIEDLLSLLEDAKLQQKRHGIVQWNMTYPTKKDIEKDVLNGVLFMYFSNEELIGAVTVRTEDVTLYIERIMVVGTNTGKGYASQIVLNVIHEARLKKCLCIQTTTNHTNFAMRKILSNNNFDEVGRNLKSGREHFGDFINYRRLLS